MAIKKTTPNTLSKRTGSINRKGGIYAAEKAKIKKYGIQKAKQTVQTIVGTRTTLTKPGQKNTKLASPIGTRPKGKDANPTFTSAKPIKAKNVGKKYIKRKK
jgi:hypothetical protein